MKDQLGDLPWYLQPWSYWLPNPPTGAPTPLGDPWPQSSPSAAPGLSGGLLGNLTQPAGGILGNLARPGGYAPTTPGPAINSPMTWAATTIPSCFFPAPVQNSWASDKLDPRDSAGGVATPNAQKPPPIRPSVPLSGADDGLPSSPEPAPPKPPKDLRTWLVDALSDQNVRYYAGPHLYEALRKLHALTQLLPGSGTVQSTQDASRAGEEAQAGNYGKAAAHFGMGTVNAALDWLPPAKLAILGGMLARTFPWERLPTALEMEAAGKSAEKMWWEAGLERDAADNLSFGVQF